LSLLLAEWNLSARKEQAALNSEGEVNGKQESGGILRLPFVSLAARVVAIFDDKE
jgi:hypothetical protein